MHSGFSYKQYATFTGSSYVAYIIRLSMKRFKTTTRSKDVISPLDAEDSDIVHLSTNEIMMGHLKHIQLTFYQ